MVFQAFICYALETHATFLMLRKYKYLEQSTSKNTLEKLQFWANSNCVISDCAKAIKFD